MINMEVIPATPDQEPVLENLLELYTHDFSEFRDLELGEDGRFAYPFLWFGPDRHPFLVRVDGKLAGFVLVNRETIWDMAEFFIVRGYRRRGVGTSIAHQVWRRFPGAWQVRVMESNHAAHSFWERAISEFSGETIHSAQEEKIGKRWHVFSFESKRV
jgi:predicted acetyltransferase